jgi:hypothetical protein
LFVFAIGLAVADFFGTARGAAPDSFLPAADFRGFFSAADFFGLESILRNRFGRNLRTKIKILP